MSTMVYCRGCGKEIHETAEFCPSCEAPLPNARTGGKDKVHAAVLAFFLGAFGIHHFYLRQWWGIFYLLFFWTYIPSIISLIETFVFLFSNQQKWDNKYNEGVNSVQRSGVEIVIISFIFIAMYIVFLASVIPESIDYTPRKQVAEGYGITKPYKKYLTEYYTKTNDFTGLSTSDLQGDTTGKYVDSVTIAKASKGTIVLVATFNQPGVSLAIQGKEFRVATEDGGITWACGYGIQNPLLRGENHVQSKYLLGSCKRTFK